MLLWYPWTPFPEAVIGKFVRVRKTWQWIFKDHEAWGYSVKGAPRYTAIEYIPKVRELCAKHPEMGVCQYEREACRASGGRVYDARGTEITKQIEAEYDKKVMRVRFRAG